VLLSALALSGAASPAEAEQAFIAAMSTFGRALEGLRLTAREECGLEHVDGALERIASSTPHIRKKVLEAAAAAIIHDGKVLPPEMELLRAVAESLDCPM